MKKTMKRHSFISRLASLVVVCGLTLAFGSCANDDLAQNGKTSTDDKGLTAFSTGEPATRTTMEADGKFYWEAGDKIWVKDDSGNWKQSSNSPAGKTASFKFLMPGKYTAKSSYEVYYPGKNGNKDKVTISANQTQTEPNTTAHFGASGDCGIAKATRNATSHEFEFALDHKAAYLVFKPYTSNDVLKYCYLTKIEVTSDNDIASTSTYTLDPTADTGAGALTGTGNGKQIVLTTKGNYGSTYQNGFPLTNTSANLATNGAYMVIKPGTHTLRIRYWVKDVATQIEGTITKIIPSHTFAKNEYVNMEADLQIKNYDGDKYYMWDAQQQYWKGQEWDLGGSQPTLIGQPAGNYARNNSDVSRWYHEGGGSGRFDATQSCASLPNANEMSWYVMYGDPRWDADELWTTMGHLYKGRMWFKKKSVLQAENHYNTEKSANGTTDLRTTYKNYINSNSSILSGLPSVADANKYFYLPVLGDYEYGHLLNVGVSSTGEYWSSSANPANRYGAYWLHVGNSYVSLQSYDRYGGFRVGGFE